MHRTGSKWIPIVGGLLSAWYAFNTWFAWSMENCTMGNTDGYVGGLIIALPGALLALAALARSGTSRWVGVTLLVAAIPPGLLLGIVVPWFISATVTGHHLCGPEYDSYLPYSAALRFLPALHLTLSAALMAACLVQSLRLRGDGVVIAQSRGGQP